MHGTVHCQQPGGVKNLRDFPKRASLFCTSSSTKRALAGISHISPETGELCTPAIALTIQGVCVVRSIW